MSAILKSRSEIDNAIHWLKEHGFTQHACHPKNWDLAQVLAHIGDGNLLDMGCNGSFVLPNVHPRLKGDHWGTELVPIQNPLNGCDYWIGTLDTIQLPPGFFKYITCLSVIEHGVDHVAFLKEAARLLEKSGELFVTFDYWSPPWPTSTINGLPWKILSAVDVSGLVVNASIVGLSAEPTTDMSLGDPVINKGYWSPDGRGYTFCFLKFTKV